MGKKPPASGKRGGVRLPAKSRRASARPGKAAARGATLATGERLREAMEELEVARAELSRLGHEMTAAHRQIEERTLSFISTESNLRAELDAVRTDLKTALAELEIARADRERLAASSHRRISDLEHAIERMKSAIGRPPSTVGAEKPAAAGHPPSAVGSEKPKAEG